MIDCEFGCARFVRELPLNSPLGDAILKTFRDARAAVICVASPGNR
jgi:hypothetical protein